MAKLEHEFRGNFWEFLTLLENSIMRDSMSAHLEDASDRTMGDAMCAIRVFERYSWLGGNRVSLNITLLGKDDRLFLSAIASGGSQAMFFKINTIGENAFLDSVRRVVRNYSSQSGRGF